MAVSASLVKELRELTGSGILECKQALEATSGDLEKAKDYLREHGQAKAAKKEARVAADGLIFMVASADKKACFIVEINSETDFVAKSDDFVNFGKSIASFGLTQKTSDLESFLKLTLDGNTIEEKRVALIAKIGENIKIRRILYAEDAHSLGCYLHGNRIAVVVALSTEDAALAKDLAMHVAANNPSVIDPKDIPAEVLEKEKAVYHAQAVESGKNPAFLDKMVTGKLNKFMNEVSLLKQPFLKDPEKPVEKLLAEKGTKVLNFVRWELGEGIHKEVKDFAEEVMSQIKK